MTGVRRRLPVGQPMAGPLFLLALDYRTVDSILGCYVVARLTPDRPLTYALALGAVGVILSSVGAIALWNAGTEYGPSWYPLSLIAIALPCAWIGGILGQAHRQAAKAV
jgi:hypothetical protein